MRSTNAGIVYKALAVWLVLEQVFPFFAHAATFDPMTTTISCRKSRTNVLLHNKEIVPTEVTILRAIRS